MKKSIVGGIVAILVFGVCLTGCASVMPGLSAPPNYYNLGNVSEENCALIQVWAAGGMGGDYSFSPLVRIDGQGSYNQWKPSNVFGGAGESIVRVTPGNHTFTINFIYEKKEIPVSITYDCKPGHGYTFGISVKNIEGGVMLNPIEAEITIFELIPDENGNFGGLGSKNGSLGGFGSNLKVADKHKETFHQEALKMRS